MDGGHETLLDAEVVVHDLGERGQAVRGAGGVGHDLVFWLVGVVVDAHDEGRRDLVLRGGGDDDLFRAAGKVGARRLGGEEGARALNDVLRAGLSPGNGGGVALREDADGLAVDDDGVVARLDGAVEAPENGVILEHVNELGDIRVAEVQRADLHVFALGDLTEREASDASEAVDADFDRHIRSPI